MSDEQPHEVGSRRRRREIREARERAAAAEREREESLRRRLSFDEALREEEGEKSAPRKPVTRSEAGSSDEVFDQSIFDQEAPQQKAASSNGARQKKSASRAGVRGTRQPSPVETGAARRSPAPKSSASSAESPAPSRRRAQLQAAQSPAQPQKQEMPKPLPVSSVHAPAAGASAAQNQPADTPEEPEPARPGATPAEPFESVVSPHRAASPAEPHEEGPVEFHEDRPRDFLDDHLEDDEQFQERIEHDEDGTPLLISSSSYGRGYQTVTPVDSSVSRTVLQRRRQRRRRRNLTLAAALAGFTVLVIGFVWAVGAFLGGGGPEDYDQVAGDTVEFTVTEGDVPEAIFNRLVDEEIVASEEALNEAWSAWQAEGGDDLLRTGDFALYEEMPAEDAIAAIFDGEEASHYFSINSGMRIDDVLDAIAEQTGVDRRELSEINENPQQLGLPEGAETLEGYLAVGEYSPTVEASAEEILREPVERTFEELEELGVEEGEQFELITKASLVTAEAHYDADGGDYATIAGAIENRLEEQGDEDSETEGYLQIDAAVIYGLGTQQIHFTDEEREDADNEYNTYQHTGLTPGPIEAPHPEALAAVADPDANDYLYWVTVDLETGETLFATTYSDHQENVQLLNEYCEENSEICSGEPAEQAEAVEPGE